MSEVYQAGGVGEEGDEVAVVRGGGGGSGGLPFYHVPQQSRREKLRYPNSTDEPPLHHPPPPPPFFHYDAQLTAAATANSTATFMSPSSSSFLQNPNYSAGPYDHATALLLRDHLLDHPLLDNDYEGVSLSLSSTSTPSHQQQFHHHHFHPLDASPLGGGPPLPPAVPRVPVPAGPFTGYATILKCSGFLRPAQQLLGEVCGTGGVLRGALASAGDGLEVSDLAEAEVAGYGATAADAICSEGGEHRGVKSRLMSMLDEVCRRYRQYYQQIHAAITSFESVAGLSMAAPFTSFALNCMSKHFRCLKNAISDQLRFTNRALGKESHSTYREEISAGFRLINGDLCYQRAAQSSGATNQHQVWRPQRGLPERAVAVLRAWLFEHFLHPYPTDMDKQMLAKQTGLSRNQVSNWFINARVRLWKPMVEEIHSLETRQACKAIKPEADHHNRGGNKGPRQPTTTTSSSSAAAVPPDDKRTPQNVHSYLQRNPDPSPKRFRNELSQQAPINIEEPLNFSNFDDDNLSVHHHHHHRVGVVGMGSACSGSAGSVSLTLGLQQNINAICSPEPLPLNVARRFGLDQESSVVDAYVMSTGFERLQDQSFGKGVINDGQLFHDFIG